MGEIALEGMRFYAHHGYYAEENELGTDYIVDVYLRFDFSKAAEGDLLKETINYESVYEVCREVMLSQYRLLEALSLHICDKLLDKYDEVHWVKTRVSKTHPPLSGPVDRASISFERSREEWEEH